MSLALRVPPPDDPGSAHKPSLASPDATDPRFETLHRKAEGALRIPPIKIAGHCETEAVAAVFAALLADRRLSRAHGAVEPGGIARAIQIYAQSKTPNLILVESVGGVEETVKQLDALADVCNPGTKVIVLGRENDVGLYRELIARGVSEYMVLPVSAISLMEVVFRLYGGPQAAKLGRTVAFIGARGGVGSSTIAHNVADALARADAAHVIVADLDVPFGSASLGFNLEPGPGLSQALREPDRLDDVLLERLLSKRGEHLSVLASPGALADSDALEPTSFDRLIEVAQSSAAYVALDLPHAWSGWVRKILLEADDVVITAGPDLVGLYNTKSLLEFLARARPNDGTPKVVLNQICVGGKTEISSAKFAAALNLDAVSTIRFQPKAFSKAANSGRLVADLERNGPAAGSFAQIARRLNGQEAVAGSPKGPLASLWQTLRGG